MAVPKKNIAEAFSNAEGQNAVLLFDEVDSFLSDRSALSHHWEVTQVNQFLIAMERYHGILVCTTNLGTKLDKATLRRFDSKIIFDYLKHGQAVAMLENLLDKLEFTICARTQSRMQSALAGAHLAAGDFAVLLRQYAVLGKPDSVDTVLGDLGREAGHRKTQEQSIGFLVAVK